MYNGFWVDGIGKLKSLPEWLLAIAILGVAIFIGYMGAKSFGNPLRFVQINRWVLLVVLAAVFVGVSSQMKADELKKPCITPYGVISFELAKDSETAKNILDNWGEDTVNVAKYQTWMDFLFILAYVAALSFICFWVAEGNKGILSLAGLTIGWILPVAGLFDVIENIALLRMLNSGADDLPARIAFWMALPKFTIILCLAIPFVLLSVVILVISGLSRLRQ